MDAAHEEMTAAMRPWRQEGKSGQETTEARLEYRKPTSEDIESGAEHREVPKEHSAVETGSAPNKQHRDRHLGEKRRGQPEERTRGNCGSRKNVQSDTAQGTRASGTRPGQCCTPRTSKRRTFGRRHRPKPECNNGIRNRSPRQQLQSKREFNKTLRKNLAAGCSASCGRWETGPCGGDCAYGLYCRLCINTY
jgi:hypothetical protein